MSYTPPSQVKVVAQPHLNLRKAPMIAPDNIIARLADGTTWMVVGVARESFDPSSSVMWVQVEFADPATGQKAMGFCRTDFVAPRADPLPATQRVLPSDGLNLRSSPAFGPAINNKIVTMRSGSTLRVLGGVWENLDPSSGKWWYFVDYEGQRGYAYARYLGDEQVGEQPAGEESIPAGIPSPTWKFGVCLAGVGNAEPSTWHEPSFHSAIDSARLEAIKILPLDNDDTMNRVYRWIKSRNTAFVMVRLRWKPSREWAKLATPQERIRVAAESFLNTVKPQLELAYTNGVRYFEVHNEPNTPANFNPGDLDGDGLGTAWMGPGEFAEWFSRVTDAMRGWHGDIYLGFPGLSPQGAPGGSDEINIGGRLLTWGTQKWLAACKTMIQDKADWVGVHCYWQEDGAGRFGLEDVDSGGMYWKRVAAQIPGKLLFITEYSNNDARKPPAVKGKQYAKYMAMLRREKRLGAAFAYSIYWSSDPHNERWVSVNEQGKFRVNELSGEMGREMELRAVTKEQVKVDGPTVWV